jgi:hypothetical protein
VLANVSTVACFGDLTDRAIATFADRFGVVSDVEEARQ